MRTTLKKNHQSISFVMSNQLGLAQVRRVIMSLSIEHNLIAIVFFTVLTQKMLSNAIRLVC